MKNFNSIIIMLTLGLTLSACNRTPVQDGVAVDDANMSESGSANSTGLGGSDGTNGSGLAGSAGGDGDPLSKRVVYFEYDSSLLTPEAQIIVEAHANYMIANPGLTLVLEGHADERGTREYNLALGEDRARSLAKLIQIMGVDGSSLRSISYGEERPVALGHDESAWGLNRRVEILYGN
ncbi:MAG: peptidoglycan-associated lipoprotein [Gammaproteobacteria bacterium]|jgi:peptidoglycan-associated lipoprotein